MEGYSVYSFPSGADINGKNLSMAAIGKGMNNAAGQYALGSYFKDGIFYLFVPNCFGDIKNSLFEEEAEFWKYAILTLDFPNKKESERIFDIRGYRNAAVSKEQKEEITQYVKKQIVTFTPEETTDYVLNSVGDNLQEQKNLELQIELLENLPYTQAWTGELGNLKQKSYVEYDQVLKLINSKRLEIKKIKNQEKN